MRRAHQIFLLAVAAASLSLATAFILLGIPLASLAAISLGIAWSAPLVQSVRKHRNASDLSSGNYWLAGFTVGAVISALQGGVFFWFGLGAMVCALAAWDLQAFIQITSFDYPMELLPEADQSSGSSSVERDHLRLLGIVLAAGGGLATASALAGMVIHLTARLPVVLGLGVALVVLVVWLGRILLSRLDQG